MPSLKKNAEGMDAWENIFQDKARALYPATDPSHDFLHICRVVKNATYLTDLEDADPNVTLPAAYFHDFVNVPKGDPRRKQASMLSSVAAAKYLSSIGYSEQHLEPIKHAIAAHSFSAEIKPETLEAKIVQDADRLDALGAIGIARCFSTAALLQSPYYCLNDPWAESRAYDDREFTIDHFPVKLFKIATTMQTEAAKHEAQKRLKFMEEYLHQLKSEI
jgi:uncharacterized protein